MSAFDYFVFMILISIWATPWKNVSSGDTDQARHKPACAATEASMRLEILVTETRDITLSRQRITKALIRLICAFVVRIWHKTHFLMARLIYIWELLCLFRTEPGTKTGQKWKISKEN